MPNHRNTNAHSYVRRNDVIITQEVIYLYALIQSYAMFFMHVKKDKLTDIDKAEK